ncbi:PTS galactitol transporter subunit IIA [Halolactibacillus alkaliphilus]|uniref:PTS galactitol transporter subunit IIA n=1 Tax=Halolactibacillus alkaliphilus TaxID=442899 RepID=A0A511X3B7_9BACI|nr:PTS sugar transporter subunit IIA [Halolactibacillus alkaliphilus]GEN57432.1 PTS galactitol transporter subunit IIA [Halolactibacillus alkaliphilus]GGN68465.1 PTS galactitol transporter subunit IIA [Halolactibacillus alkaliphilus]SFO94894.1 PTS system IIA component, Gat family (TC 4.A.5) [Halolactibacillus alkaliphilus]
MSQLNFNESLIFTKLKMDSKEEIIRHMAENMVEKKLVKKGYTEAVIEREKEFATGLPTGSLSVAIPHTDVKHVNKKSISIATLREPVLFGVMGDDDTTPVKLIFMLAMDEEHSQLSLLQKLMAIFQDDELLSTIHQEDNKTTIKNIIETKLDLTMQEGELNV